MPKSAMNRKLLYHNYTNIIKNFENVECSNNVSVLITDITSVANITFYELRTFGKMEIYL